MKRAYLKIVQFFISLFKWGSKKTFEEVNEFVDFIEDIRSDAKRLRMYRRARRNENCHYATTKGTKINY